MTSISTTHSTIWSSGAQQCCFSRRFSETRGVGHLGPAIPYRPSLNPGQDLVYSNNCHRSRKHQTVQSSLLDNSDPGDPEDENSKDTSKPDDQEAIGNSFRENLEKIIGADDSKFNGEDLAAIIRNKYGKSYDVQLIKKEFMGRNLLAMNVMWKYREQRSFPLTEEEYILRLDGVANNLKCWGAVSHIRSSLAKSKERPRIGKAVSIFIDMDESGARSNEWIYK